jgi:hypothetical protein
VICREPIENVQMHILIVPALFGALVAVADRRTDTDAWLRCVRSPFRNQDNYERRIMLHSAAHRPRNYQRSRSTPA